MLKLNVYDLGIMDYIKALEIQEKMFEDRTTNKIGNTILFVEHPPVITIGRRGKRSNILLSEIELKENNIKFYDINRGGDVTYHGPGQLVGYLIFDLKEFDRDIKKFIYNLEEVFIRMLKRLFNIDANREENKYTGVWVGGNKITAIGIFINKFITMHGFAFNINTNLDHFKWIIPCGIEDRGVTSLENILKKKLDIEWVKRELIRELRSFYG